MRKNESSVVTSFQNPSLTFSFTHEIKTGKFGWTTVKSCDIPWFYKHDKMVCKVVLNLLNYKLIQDQKQFINQLIIAITTNLSN